MIGWLDASSGASGDMLLGAVVDAGADESVIRAAIEGVAPQRITFSTEAVSRGALAARRAVVDVAESSTTRGLGDVLRLITAAHLPAEVAEHASAVFTLLAEAEAGVHGSSVDDVHFHEVGALDAIADIVGVCAGLVNLDLEALHCSAVAVGSGSVAAAHGRLSVPAPAVVRLLQGIETYAGPAATELCTPTGAALLRHWVTAWGPQPAMAVTAAGVGAGSRDFASHPNVLRLLVGTVAATGAVAGGPAAAGGSGVLASGAASALVIETNVDDLDPRLWPRVLSLLLQRGASDCWLTPILMKKGRAAHTLSVLVRAEHAQAVRTVIFEETSAIGLREYGVSKHELAREMTAVSVGGCDIRIKIARHEGAVVNVQPEYDDVVAAAETLGRPAKAVLAEAIAALPPRLSHRELRENV